MDNEKVESIIKELEAVRNNDYSSDKIATADKAINIIKDLKSEIELMKHDVL